MNLVNKIYKITENFPQKETFGLLSQMRRSAVSIPSNIAEGSSRKSILEFIRFLNISYGSVAELETQVTIAKNQTFLTEKIENQVLEMTAEITKILSGLINSLEKKLNSKL